MATATEKKIQIPNIIGKTKAEIDSFYSEEITVEEGYQFSQYQTIRKITLYFSSRFLKGAVDRDRFKKLFFNIVRSRASTAAKSVDLDTKDVRVIAEDGQSYYPAWFFERELKQFMKDENFGQFLNKLVENWPRYGTVVVKNVDGVPKYVPIRNIIIDQKIDTIGHSPRVIEKHPYDLDEYQDLASKHGWENTAAVVAMYETAGESEVLVCERYGWAREKEVDETKTDSTRLVKCMFLIAGLDLYRPRQEGQRQKKTYTPEVIFKQKIDEWPYRDLHWEEVEGRYLGEGVVEVLFPNQEFRNETVNTHRKSFQWSSKKLFQRRGAAGTPNLFTEVGNGEVLDVGNAEISPIAIEERNLPDYNALGVETEKNANELAFTFEINTGEALPSGTPFRLGAILSRAVETYYAMKREKLGLFVRGLIFDFVIPGFKNKKNKAHLLNFNSDSEDIQKVYEMVSEYLINRYAMRYVEDSGFYPAQEDIDREREKILIELQKRGAMHFDVPDGFYDDLKYRLDVMITAEQRNVEAEVETYVNLITAIGANPAMQQDPTVRKLLEHVMNLVGKSPIQFLPPRQTTQPQQGQAVAQPGAVKAPAVPQEGEMAAVTVK